MILDGLDAELQILILTSKGSILSNAKVICFFSSDEVETKSQRLAFQLERLGKHYEEGLQWSSTELDFVLVLDELDSGLLIFI